ncbi:MAG: 16S rRNA (guanine(966)-N(2))-methyltransferase RsmD [Candidatus Omnitrophica bacterium]|nr:16S rRNA (guanine(966)-N(2))-methyltransferase RsmD [Candidatus Omnitrophota bacterium]MCM8802559.1 16S rRNA (guanine(966)-N(2))-methyltransferase RsmD [Candidatus Omnitrophota bacterium]
MRVISGIYKGRKLKFIKDQNIRPTKDVVREAIFDSLREWIVGKKVVEIFAGSGILGIEAVSHGAKKVIFIEKDKKGIEVIKENIKSLGIEKKCEILKGDCEYEIEKLENIKYNLVIGDPPYDFSVSKLQRIIEKIKELNILKKGGIMVIEYDYKKEIPVVEGYEVIKRRKYGRTSLTYLRRIK